MAVSKVEVNEKPLDKNALDELIKFSGYKVDMILQYDDNDKKGCYLLFVKYNNGQVIRQVYTQRKTPRKFVDIRRALDWGKKVGFKSVFLSIDYDDYVEGLNEID